MSPTRAGSTCLRPWAETRGVLISHGENICRGRKYHEPSLDWFTERLPIQSYRQRGKCAGFLKAEKTPKGALGPATNGGKVAKAGRVDFDARDNWRGAVKNQPPARTDKRADAAREKGNAVTNRERYRFFSALFKKVLAVNCSNGSVFLFSQIPSLKSVCLPSINSCGKAAAK